MRGRFITFEGGEGGGKSTQAALLAQHLRSTGIDVLVTREPGGSPGAEIIRHVILSGAAKPLGADAETILFAAARDDHIRMTIAPALTAGTWVICDRFLDSTRVYQGLLGHVDRKLIRALERVIIGSLMPDLTFVMDVPAEVGLERAAGRRGNDNADRFESETIDFHERLRQAFAALAKVDADRCVLIDATQPRDTVHDAIWKTVAGRFGLTQRVKAGAGGR
jgi:dTMP kinase